MRLKVKRLTENAVLPKRATDGSAGYDLFADAINDIIILPGEAAAVPIGISVEIECGEKSAAGFIFARSSMGTKYGVIPANAVGVIDSDYRGEICVVLRNLSKLPYTVKNHDRVAQLVISEVLIPEVEETEVLSDTGRGDGGFGSTGR